MTEDDGFAHELDEQFARLRDSTMTVMPDPEIRDMFDACLPPHLRSPSLTDQLVSRALYDLADDWVTRWLIRIFWVVLIACAGLLIWAFGYHW